MDNIVNGIKNKSLKKTILIPGDKSITHRAIILSSIASGESIVTNYLNALDCQNTIKCMQKLGVKIEEKTPLTLKIYGKGMKGLQAPGSVLNVGNSGTTMRLLAGLLSGQEFVSIIDGDDSIRKRPMDRIIRPLSLMNASIDALTENRYAPLKVTGKPLQPVNYTVPVASAQVKSAILLAGLYADGETIIKEKQQTRNHTERMLRFMQVDIKRRPKQIISIAPVKELKNVNIDIPGDISSAAYFLALGCARKNSELIIRNVGINKTRTGFLELLKGMGANIKIINKKVISNEPRADLLLRGGTLKGIKVDKKIIANIIDELPLVAVLGALAKGKTMVEHAQELRIKESDRIKAIVEGLTKMGAKITEKEDGFEVVGPAKLKGNTVCSYQDHRIAMSLIIAASYAEGKTVIQEAQCIDISYPGFIDDYQQVIK